MTERPPHTPGARRRERPRGEMLLRPTPGLTLPRRARPRIWLGLVAATALAGALAALAVWHVRSTETPIWTVAQVAVEGNRSLSEREILSVLEIGPGTPWWALQPEADRLRAREPRIRAVDLAYRFPRGLSVRIQEREAILFVAGDSLLVLARDGTLLRPDPALDPTDLPCLTGPALNPRSSIGAGGLMRAGQNEYAWLRQLLEVREQLPDLWRSISQIEYRGERDFRVVFRSARRMLLWDPALNGHLWAQIPNILVGLAEHDLADDVVLDMRFRDRIVVRYPEERTPPDVGALPSPRDTDSGLPPDGRPRGGV